jgi:ribonucleotide reductase alpha subunit
MTNNNIKIVVTQNYQQTKSKQEHISDYIESLKAIEDAMEPYKEQKRELKKEYLEKKWLSKEDISLSVRALRLLKDNIDIGALIDMYEALKGDGHE